MLYDSNYFTKENLDTYLNELAKEYQHMSKKTMPVEIILIGGAAAVACYGFRDMTADVDCVIQASSVMKDAINRVGDKYNLPNGWLNSDFTKTASYSAKLIEVSVHYRQFMHILDVRMVTGEYLIAMKLRSGRSYKNDMPDIVGILAEHTARGTPIAIEQIKNAVNKLYGEWETLPLNSRLFIEELMKNNNPESVFEIIRTQEIQSKDILLKFDEKYPGAVNTENAADIIEKLKGINKTGQY